MTSTLRAHKVCKTYKLGTTNVIGVKDVDLEVPNGAFLAIAGPSGSGKSTLLNILGCLDSPSHGTLEIAGQDVTHLKPKHLAEIRNYKVGFIFQTFNLIPVMTAFENVEFPLLLINVPKEQRKERVMESLTAVGLERHAKHRPEELSGGQRQRVAIARALVKEPALVLADEPTANLDSVSGDEIIKLMQHMNKVRGTTFVFSTHDQKIIECATSVTYIKDGELQTA